MSVIVGQPYGGAMSPPGEPGAKTWFLHVLLLAALAATVTLWAAMLITGASGYELEKYISLAGFFGVACASFVVPRVGAGLQNLFEIPAFMTLVAFVMFGAAPLVCFLHPSALIRNLRGDTSLFHPALEIVIVGMAAFWLGSAIARPRKQPAAGLDPRSLPGSAPQNLTLVFGICLYAASLTAKIYMLRAGMYSYLGSLDAYYTHLAAAQVWMVIEGFGLYALIVIAIEAYQHPGDKVRALLLWAVFGAQCFWGLISAMKHPVLENFLAIALVSSIAKQKLQIRWLALLLAALIGIYPLVNRFRTISSATHSEASTRFSAVTEALRGAAEQTARQEGTAGTYLGSGWSSSVSRLNMLQDVAVLLAYQDQSYKLEGDQRLWMIPFYPFIPRFIWSGKPVQDVGLRFTRLIGGRETYCTSPTIPGELYVLHGGIPAVLVGMFLVGLVAQWLTNPVKLCPSKRNLFIYACVFSAATNWEADFFTYSTLLIRTVVIVQILASIIYGPARAPSHLRARRQTAT